MIRWLFRLAGTLLVIALIVTFAVYLHIENTTKNARYQLNDSGELTHADAIVVLGAGVHEDGSLTPFLRDRVQVGVDLYKAGVADKLIMSGDGRGINGYDEVAAMTNRAQELGVADAVGDEQGLSTYDSMLRARDTYECKRVIVVTQGFHLPRGVYIAKELGLQAQGVSADISDYTGTEIFKARELLADVKAWARFSLPFDIGGLASGD